MRAGMRVDVDGRTPGMHHIPVYFPEPAKTSRKDGT